MSGLPVKQARELMDEDNRPEWLIEGLWAEQAVGILGGEPKCCKSFMALDVAVSVASGSPCLRQFPVRRTGHVLLFPAEDALGVVHRRLQGICAAANTAIDDLPLFVITAPRLLLDLPQDRDRLRKTLAVVRPALLVLDPFIRLHRADENASKEIAPLLGYLRELQREFHMAVLLVHHVRKGASKERPGQALRGSSDMHGWGDSNLYLRRSHGHLLLSVEHRAAPSCNDISVDLISDGDSLALSVLDQQPPDPEPRRISTAERVVQVLHQAHQPLSSEQLRKLCRVRTSTLCRVLADLRRQGHVIHGPKGYSLEPSKHKFPVSLPNTPIDPSGKGNGKQSDQPLLPFAFNHQLP